MKVIKMETIEECMHDFSRNPTYLPQSTALKPPCDLCGCNIW